MTWVKTHPDVIVIILISVFLAALRIGGDKSAAFIEAAHLWVFGLIFCWLMERRIHYPPGKEFWLPALALTGVEIVCFTVGFLKG